MLEFFLSFTFAQTSKNSYSIRDAVDRLHFESRTPHGEEHFDFFRRAFASPKELFHNLKKHMQTYLLTEHPTCNEELESICLRNGSRENLKRFPAKVHTSKRTAEEEIDRFLSGQVRVQLKCLLWRKKLTRGTDQNLDWFTEPVFDIGIWAGDADNKQVVTPELTRFAAEKQRKCFIRKAIKYLKYSFSTRHDIPIAPGVMKTIQPNTPLYKDLEKIVFKLKEMLKDGEHFIDNTSIKNDLLTIAKTYQNFFKENPEARLSFNLYLTYIIEHFHMHIQARYDITQYRPFVEKILSDYDYKNLTETKKIALLNRLILDQAFIKKANKNLIKYMQDIPNLKTEIERLQVLHNGFWGGYRNIYETFMLSNTEKASDVLTALFMGTIANNEIFRCKITPLVESFEDFKHASNPKDGMYASLMNSPAFIKHLQQFKNPKTNEISFTPMAACSDTTVKGGMLTGVVVQEYERQLNKLVDAYNAKAPDKIILTFYDGSGRTDAQRTGTATKSRMTTLQGRDYTYMCDMCYRFSTLFKYYLTKPNSSNISPEIQKAAHDLSEISFKRYRAQWEDPAMTGLFNGYCQEMCALFNASARGQRGENAITKKYDPKSSVFIKCKEDQMRAIMKTNLTRYTGIDPIRTGYIAHALKEFIDLYGMDMLIEVFRNYPSMKIGIKLSALGYFDTDFDGFYAAYPKTLQHSVQSPDEKIVSHQAVIDFVRKRQNTFQEEMNIIGNILCALYKKQANVHFKGSLPQNFTQKDLIFVWPKYTQINLLRRREIAFKLRKVLRQDEYKVIFENAEPMPKKQSALYLSSLFYSMMLPVAMISPTAGVSEL